VVPGLWRSVVRGPIGRETIAGALSSALGLFAVIVGSTFRYSTQLATSYNPRVFPQVVGLLLLVSGVALLFTKNQVPIKAPELKKAAALMTVLLLYTFAVRVLGWRLATPLMIFASLLVLDERKWKILLAVPILTTVISHIVFYEVLFINFPRGFLGW
jgi:uncharacterized membrane protein SirB2